MMDDILNKVRTRVQQNLKVNTMNASQAFRQVIARPPEPTPQELWQNFISQPTEARQAEIAAIGPEAYQQKVDDMLTLGEQLIGPQARNLMPYFEQDLAMAQFQPQMQVPGMDIAETSTPSYPSLVDQALAEVENYGNPEIPTNLTAGD
jgi:hypothetical protein